MEETECSVGVGVIKTREMDKTSIPPDTDCKMRNEEQSTVVRSNFKTGTGLIER
jgi:hypothetical protein